MEGIDQAFKWMTVSMPFRSDRLEQARRAHAGADAHRHHAVFLLAPAHAVHDGRGANGAGRPEWMPESDGAAERVDSGRIEAEVANHGEGLRCKRFIQFDPVDVVLPDAG